MAGLMRCNTPKETTLGGEGVQDRTSIRPGAKPPPIQTDDAELSMLQGDERTPLMSERSQESGGGGSHRSETHVDEDAALTRGAPGTATSIASSIRFDLSASQEQ